ncbi:IucA/IucC family protein, partial [Candidatus Protofrankia californiensis]|uniref:IucA/IucC family protein n=1 Tax=Candidatus Protofrankia californiensis TaxID=1839754 RepID=UPI0024B4CB5D
MKPIPASSPGGTPPWTPGGQAAGPAGSAAATAADTRVTETLLRCWVRENGITVGHRGSLLRIDLPASGLVLDTPVRYRSACGWHRFGPLTTGGLTVDAGLLAALLVREVTNQRGLPPSAGTDCLGRIINSLRHTAVYVETRAATPRTPATPSGPAAPTTPSGPAAPATPSEAATPVGPDDAACLPPFLAAEQALITGHPFHPAAKSREDASAAELATYSPELRGSFPLHWFAAHPSVAASGGTIGGHSPAELLRSLLPSRDLTAAYASYLPLPAHPWQAHDLRARADVTAMIADGLLVDLGPVGPPWYPTASLRTVWRPDAPVMLKLSLGMRITNSRRVNLRGELELGTQISVLLDAGLRDWLVATHPGFHLLEDPAWVGLDAPDTAGSARGSIPEGWAGTAGPGTAGPGAAGPGLER